MQFISARCTKKQTLSKHLVKTYWVPGAGARHGGFREEENTGPALQGPGGVVGRIGLETEYRRTA